MKLAAYLREKDLTDGSFAKKAKLSVYAIRKYKYGKRIPRPQNMLRIKKVTGGLVTEGDWYR